MEAQTPILENMTSSLRHERSSSPSEGTPLLREKGPFPSAHRVRSKSNGPGRFPQTIAHRGYKNKYPENTMGAFKGAVEAGSHAIETDLHLSRDGVVVISHDATLKRVFGVNKYVIDCDWEYLKTLRTLKEPHDRIPRLQDLLEYLATPGLEDVWLLLDIKLANDPATIMRRLAETIESVPPGTRPWHERIVLGCWSAKHLPLARTHLPNFPITIITFSISYARQFLSIPNVSFNVNQKVLMGPLGSGFLEEAKAAGRPVFVWTVNKRPYMRWCVRKHLDGVVTDNPALFRTLCDEWDEDDDNGKGKGRDEITAKEQLELLFVAVIVVLFGWLKLRHLPAVDGYRVAMLEDSTAATKKIKA